MQQARTCLERSSSDNEASLAAILTGIAYSVFYSADNDRIKIVLEARRRSKDANDAQLYMRIYAMRTNFISQDIRDIAS